ncbi:MAG: WbqC family protein [Pseudomonadota bacterium]
MIVAIHQPQYLPWMGYFHKMIVADAFCLLDNVQYKKNEWQNRNRIKTANGWQWLTVPVSFQFPEKICEIKIINNTHWVKKHIQALNTNYRKAPYFDEVMGIITSVYEREWERLCDLNKTLIQLLRDYLGVGHKPIATASDLEGLSDEPTMRLIDICNYFGADTYLSGPDGPKYMDMDAFNRNGIKVMVQQFQHPQYPQCFGTFQSHMSIIDLLFNCGPNSYEVIASS